MKKCVKCQQDKNKEEFKIEHRNADGRTSKCRICLAEERRENRKRNISHYREKEAAYNLTQVRSGYCNKYYHKTKTPEKRMLMSFRTLMRRYLKGQIKKSKTRDYLGCTAEELRQHLEKAFSSEMSWNNYGVYWHIDHIIPCTAFDFSKDEQIKKCFHFSNLQPLPASKNISKGDKLPDGSRARFLP